MSNSTQLFHAAINSELMRALALPHSQEREHAVADWHEKFGSRHRAHEIRAVLASFDGMQAMTAAALSSR